MVDKIKCMIQTWDIYVHYLSHFDVLNVSIIHSEIHFIACEYGFRLFLNERIPLQIVNNNINIKSIMSLFSDTNFKNIYLRVGCINDIDIYSDEYHKENLQMKWNRIQFSYRGSHKNYINWNAVLQWNHQSGQLVKKYLCKKKRCEIFIAKLNHNFIPTIQTRCNKFHESSCEYCIKIVDDKKIFSNYFLKRTIIAKILQSGMLGFQTTI
tara:strand:+ start:1290 stop:1919 length:630 start_codon:yes stop_codon:yes gene_type:complete